MLAGSSGILNKNNYFQKGRNEMTQSILGLLQSKEVMYFILGFIFLGGLAFFWKMHANKNSTIDLADLVSSNGKLNERKVARFGSWIVSTWGFVYLIVSNNLTEFYFTGYMGAWVANALLGKMIKTRDTSND